LLPKDLERAKLRPVPQAVLDAYETNREVIQAIYGSDHVRRGLLYHGTGALQYDGDKYGAGMTGRLRRPLDTILERDLKPHTDPWALTQGSTQSISFATVWSYGKFYAGVYQSPVDPLEWEYGNRVAWFAYCIVDTALQSLRKTRSIGLEMLRQLRGKSVDANRYNRLQRWALDVRSDITPQTSMIDVISGQTDIPGNFGAIITVSEDDVPLAPMPLGGTYEKRAARPIGPAEFISLAVPLNRVEEYTAKVQGLGYSFPVLPIEAVEYHMSQFGVEELAHAQRVL
jgi:hypothetical protein